MTLSLVIMHRIQMGQDYMFLQYSKLNQTSSIPNYCYSCFSS